MRIQLPLILVLCVALSHVVFSASELSTNVAGVARLKKEIENVLPPNKKKDLQVGIIVTSAETGEVFY